MRDLHVSFSFETISLGAIPAKRHSRIRIESSFLLFLIRSMITKTLDMPRLFVKESVFVLTKYPFESKPRQVENE